MEQHSFPYQRKLKFQYFHDTHINRGGFAHLKPFYKELFFPTLLCKMEERLFKMMIKNIDGMIYAFKQKKKNFM